MTSPAPAFNMLDVVRLKVALDSAGLAAGANGTVVDVFAGGADYLVEFCDEGGRTVAIPTLRPSQLELVVAFTAKEA